MLLGADCVNRFLHEKEVHVEAAWSAEFGWVLSGPVQLGPEAKQKEVINVANIQADIAMLREIDQPPAHRNSLPAFPLKKLGRFYEVGLLWNSHKRPHDNKQSACAAARSCKEAPEG